jgi:SAM-dependent methyltransferase
MLRRMTYGLLEHRLNRAYRARLLTRGASPEGVFWRSEATQIARFQTLLSMATKTAPDRSLSVADIGCGYGAMLDFIKANPGFCHMRYQGTDINQEMIDVCQRRFPDEKHLFIRASKPKEMVDFCLFSGTFNLTHSTDPELWTDYIFDCLTRCMKYCRFGMAFNLLCSSKTSIKQQLYYASRPQIISRSNAQLGSTTALSTPGVNNDVSFMILKKTG